jgi:hypothetical protein
MRNAEEFTIEQELNELLAGAENKAPSPANEVAQEAPGDVSDDKKEADLEDKQAAQPSETASTEKPQPEKQKTEHTDIPQGVAPAIKAKWDTLDPDVRAAIVKREEDAHKMFTRHDSELNLGRKMKDVIQPYMPIIQAEGGNPETAVQSLLNTAYQLRTGTPQQKAAMIQQIAATYGVDLSYIQPSQTDQPDVVGYLRQELDSIKKQADPNAILNQLRDEMESDRINQEVKAFAADPANAHFVAVREDMAALLQSGRAKDMREAYDKAIWMNPELRSTLTAKQEADAQAKRKSEIESKKKAAVSVTGSAGIASSTGAKQSKSIEDELREAMMQQEGGF